MLLSHTPVVEWPEELAALLQEARITFRGDGKRLCLIDVDVDHQTLLAIHEFEAHLRRRSVQLRLPGSDECMIGEMDTSFSLGTPPDGRRPFVRVRLSFHDLQDGQCVDVAEND